MRQRECGSSGQFGDRETGNVIGASFQHDTSRELDDLVCEELVALYGLIE